MYSVSELLESTGIVFSGFHPSLSFIIDIIITLSSSFAAANITIGLSLFPKNIRCGLDLAIVGINASRKSPGLMMLLLLSPHWTVTAIKHATSIVHVCILRPKSNHLPELLVLIHGRCEGLQPLLRSEFSIVCTDIVLVDGQVSWHAWFRNRNALTHAEVVPSGLSIISSSGATSQAAAGRESAIARFVKFASAGAIQYRRLDVPNINQQVLILVGTVPAIEYLSIILPKVLPRQAINVHVPLAEQISDGNFARKQRRLCSHHVGLVFHFTGHEIVHAKTKNDATAEASCRLGRPHQ
mmetsp:Transcript_22468/g.53263  ORF Transcript_22468/g.53263 Transcript_22468/m.53263 type:complete len:297 (+) Transcript_22468:98-988(+)